MAPFKAKSFRNVLAAEGIETLFCSDPWQQKVVEAILDIKNEKARYRQAEITDSLSEAAAHLIRRGAQGIVAGCTEIPLALTQKEVFVPYFDSLRILARSAIRRAGREPV